jgi:hypothetical protein
MLYDARILPLEGRTRPTEGELFMVGIAQRLHMNSPLISRILESYDHPAIDEEANELLKITTTGTRPSGRESATGVSSPGEFHPQALAEPDGGAQRGRS